MPRKSLQEEIEDFQVEKKKLIPALLVAGVAGLVLPVLPGVALIVLALLLLNPRRGEEVIRKIRHFLKTVF